MFESEFTPEITLKNAKKPGITPGHFYALSIQEVNAALLSSLLLKVLDPCLMVDNLFLQLVDFLTMFGDSTVQLIN